MPNGILETLEARTQVTVFVSFKSCLHKAGLGAYVEIIPGSETWGSAVIHSLLSLQRSPGHQHSHCCGMGTALGQR